MISRRGRVRASLLVLLLTVLTVGPLSPAWSETTFTVSGVVSTNLGPIHDAETNQVLVWDNYGDIVADPAIAPDGSYTVQLPAGTYSFSYHAAIGDPVDGNYQSDLQTTRRDVQVSGNRTLDVFDDEPQLLVHLRDAHGQPAAGRVELYCRHDVYDWPSRDGGDPTFVVHATYSNASGTGDLEVHGYPAVQGSGDEGCELTVYPADGTWQYFDITLSDPVTNDITVNIPDAVTVQGHIATPRGDSTNWSVLATNAQGRPVAGPTTFPAGGDYTLRLSPGTYTLEFNASSDDEWMVLRKSVTVVGNATVDGETEGVPVTVHLVDSQGNPVTGRVELQCSEFLPAHNSVYSYLISRASGTGQVTVSGVPKSDTWEDCRPGLLRRGRQLSSTSTATGSPSAPREPTSSPLSRRPGR